MMRGLAYDDGYIGRKMGSVPPSGAAYGRPPPAPYMQEPYGYDYAPRGYPYMAPPPPRMVPRTYYEYDYGYPAYGYPAYGPPAYLPPPPPPPPAPRMSRYDAYLDEEPYYPEPASYVPRRRADTEPAAPVENGLDSLALVPAKPKGRGWALEGGGASVGVSALGETEGDRTLARIEKRYPALSEPQMLQEHVDKMRIKLKSLAFSLDPSGPVPEIIVPQAKKTPAAEAAEAKGLKALEFTELPKLASRRQRYYPEDDMMKDNLRIKCLSHYKTTRSAAVADLALPLALTDSSYSKYSLGKSDPKWEEPDQVFGPPTDGKKPFSKPEAIEDAPAPERERRKSKKKSKERELEALPAPVAAEPAPVVEAAPVAAPMVAPEPAPVAAEEAPIDEEMDEKERKKLEKKKRKAEREAAAKAAMEAELAALAEAEAELARLEAESATLKSDTSSIVPEVHHTKVASPPAPEAPIAAPAEVESESAAEQ